MFLPSAPNSSASDSPAPPLPPSTKRINSISICVQVSCSAPADYLTPPVCCALWKLSLNSRCTSAEGRGDRGRIERNAHERVRRALGPGHQAASIVRFQPHARKLISAPLVDCSAHITQGDSVGFGRRSALVSFSARDGVDFFLFGARGRRAPVPVSGFVFHLDRVCLVVAG